MKINIGLPIKTYADERKLTSRELAARLNLSYSTILTILREGRKVYIQELPDGSIRQNEVVSLPQRRRTPQEQKKPEVSRK